MIYDQNQCLYSGLKHVQVVLWELGPHDIWEVCYIRLEVVASSLMSRVKAIAGATSIRFCKLPVLFKCGLAIGFVSGGLWASYYTIYLFPEKTEQTENYCGCESTERYSWYNDSIFLIPLYFLIIINCWSLLLLNFQNCFKCADSFTDECYFDYCCSAACRAYSSDHPADTSKHCRVFRIVCSTETCTGCDCRDLPQCASKSETCSTIVGHAIR